MGFFALLVFANLRNLIDRGYIKKVKGFSIDQEVSRRYQDSYQELSSQLSRYMLKKHFSSVFLEQTLYFQFNLQLQTLRHIKTQFKKKKLKFKSKSNTLITWLQRIYSYSNKLVYLKTTNLEKLYHKLGLTILIGFKPIFPKST